MNRRFNDGTTLRVREAMKNVDLRKGLKRGRGMKRVKCTPELQAVVDCQMKYTETPYVCYQEFLTLNTCVEAVQKERKAQKPSTNHHIRVMAGKALHHGKK